MPADSPYFNLVFRTEPEKLPNSTLAERVDVACADPAFGLHVAQAYAAAQLPLPDLEWPAAFRRAHASFLDPEHSDPKVDAVLRLNQPENQEERDALRGTLVCPDSTIEQIANHLHLDRDVVELFEALTWNCRDRLNECLYLAQLCQIPGFSRSTVRPHGPGSQVLRTAYETGRTENVLDAAHLGPEPVAEWPAESLKEHILRRIFTLVLDGLWAGRVAKNDNPWLEPILRILAGRQKEKPMQQTAVAPLTAAEAMNLTFQWTTRQMPPNAGPTGGVSQTGAPPTT